MVDCSVAKSYYVLTLIYCFPALMSSRMKNIRVRYIILCMSLRICMRQHRGDVVWAVHIPNCLKLEINLFTDYDQEERVGKFMLKSTCPQLI